MMKLSHLSEPELEFGQAYRHIDIRFGLMDYGPLDAGQTGAPTAVRVGLIGDSETVEGTQGWLARCAAGIDGKADTRLTNLYPPFPGSTAEGPFRVAFTCDEQDTRTIPVRALSKLKNTNPLDRADRYADLFVAELRALAEGNTRPDVVLVGLPLDVIAAVNVTTDDDDLVEDGAAPSGVDFRARLKIAAMEFGLPIQIFWPTLYDPTIKIPRKAKTDSFREVQEDATRAWNLFTALYYKAGGLPWRLARDSRQMRSCFVGISFHESQGGEYLDTSTAQMFDERGEGMILRGGRAAKLSDDRRPYMTEAHAHDLLSRSMQAYYDQHSQYPARVVLHKTSPFHREEMAGFDAAVEECRIDNLDCMAVAPCAFRLFRDGQFPPLRGTLLRLDRDRAVLYSRGGVDFFKTYTGMYIPKPLMIRSQAPSQPVTHNAAEILALSKMNWNNTQFDNRDPITIAASRKVGKILKYARENDRVQTRYSFFM